MATRAGRAGSRERDERGAAAILIGAMVLLIAMAAAYAVDIGMQVNRKQELWDTLDAAAQAGAFVLPGSTATATQDALNTAVASDPRSSTDPPTIDFWCVVASMRVNNAWVVDTSQVPATCNPGRHSQSDPFPRQGNFGSTGRPISCSSTICAIPCVEPSSNTATPRISCNTIRVFAGREVPFVFAPAGGIPSGGTGNLVSVACKGSCGTIPPNPMDVSVVADRTLSMSSNDVAAMISGIKSMLAEMTPSQQYVSLGTIGRSAASAPGQPTACSSGNGAFPSGSVTNGTFVPISFSWNYHQPNGSLNAGSPLLRGVECLKEQSSPNVGTALAAPMKASARYLLGLQGSANNIPTPETRTPTPRKVLIFESDGQPNERIAVNANNQQNRFVGSTSLSNANEPFASQLSIGPAGPVVDEGQTTREERVVNNNNRTVTDTTTVTNNRSVTHRYNGGAKACQNLLEVAADAKARNVLVIVIAYNMTNLKCHDWDGTAGSWPYEDRTNYEAASSTVNGPQATTTTTERKRCPNNNQTCDYTHTTRYQTTTVTRHVKSVASPNVLDVMAQAASPTEGVAATANSNCSTAQLRQEENQDGDYFFCAASGTDMAPIFKTALSQASTGIKLMRLP